MKNLIKVTNIYFQQRDDRNYPSIQSGLVIELEDGRILSHAQDGFVEPFGEEKADATTE